jgi:hypothetical protein
VVVSGVVSPGVFCSGGALSLGVVVAGGEVLGVEGLSGLVVEAGELLLLASDDPSLVVLQAASDSAVSAPSAPASRAFI